MAKPTQRGLEQGVQSLKEENRLLRGQVSLLSDLSLRISSSLDLSTVLQRVVEAACDLTGARYGALAVFDSDGRIAQFFTHGISHAGRERIGHSPRGLGLLGQLQGPLRLADLSQHPSSAGFPPNHPAMKTFLGVPLGYRDESLGNLYLTEKQGGLAFTEGDEALLLLFAAQAALAIRNAGLHQGVEAERRRLQVLVDTSPVGVFMAEAPSGRLLLVNREAERIMGFSTEPEDRLERYERALVYRRPDGREYLPEALPLQRALYHGETVRAEEVRLEFPDGYSVPTLVNATPVYSPDGKITAAIAVIQDITPLEEIEKLRSEFLGIVSHELRTPLTAIKGSAATVLGARTPVDAAEMREFFQIIDEQADRLRDLVDNLLDMTRIEAGSLSVSIEPTGLREVLADALGTFERTGASQEVRLNVPDDLLAVAADRRRVTQVLTNLLGNAAKFSPDTSFIFIDVEHDGVHVTVRVRDQGRGIAQDKLPHLFRKFSRVHGDSGRDLSGTGLGLAICKGIVEAHGGRIWADSLGLGQGATFSFTLPVAAHSPPTARGPGGTAGFAVDTARRTDHLGRVRRQGERTKILAVDDDTQILRYLHRALREGGYQPTVVSDPREVIRLVELEEPDLVLLDLMLPGVSGYELLERIREFSGVPVVFLTAKDRDEDMVRALKMGADDYITKPFSPSELLARIEVSLRRRYLPDQLESHSPFELDGLAINFAERRVMVSGTPVSLSATEYKLLYELATHAGLVLTHDQILQRVWGPEYAGETELVRSFIRNLRRKLGDDARHPHYIFTEPQVGYRMPRPQ